jgi:hypothetical protein
MRREGEREKVEKQKNSLKRFPSNQRCSTNVGSVAKSTIKALGMISYVPIQVFQFDGKLMGYFLPTE